MDDSHLHDLLELAIGEPPPPTVNVALACSQGRRRLRWRRVVVPVAAPVAAAAAVALIVAGAPFNLGGGHVGPAAPEHKAGAHTNPALVAHPPTQFRLAVPYASFGWLPAGFSASTVLPGVGGEGTGGAQSAQNETLSAPSKQPDGKTLTLMVNAARACRVTNAGARAFIRVRDSKNPPALDCSNGYGSLGPLTGAAPAVNGQPAYWDEVGDLVWEYGRNAWAEIHPSLLLMEPHRDPHFDGWFNVAAKAPSARGPGHPAYRQSAATRALLLKIATSVHYGATTAQVYEFTLSDIPASWKSAAIPTGFQTMGGLIANTGWQLGPTSDQGGLGIAAIPAQDGYPCSFDPGQSQHVTIDGTPANLRTIDEPGKHWQSLCVNNIDGLQLWIILDLTLPGTNHTALPGGQEFGTVLSVFRHLKLLGPDPADWTTNPLR
jgi:hypothetical protein